MEIKITTEQILKALLFFSWLIFITVCIDAGGIVFNTFYCLLYNAEGANHFWQQVDLSSLYHYDVGHFLTETVLMIIVAIMRACVFYLIVKVLHDKKLNMSQPFSEEVRRFILNVSYFSLGIALFSWWGVGQTQWLAKQGVLMPDTAALRFGGADVWLFMAVILIVIAQIFKRGAEIQSENELTV